MAGDHQFDKENPGKKTLFEISFYLFS